MSAVSPRGNRDTLARGLTRERMDLFIAFDSRRSRAIPEAPKIVGASGVSLLFFGKKHHRDRRSQVTDLYPSFLWYFVAAAS